MNDGHHADRRTVLQTTAGLLATAGLAGTASAHGDGADLGNEGLGSFLNEDPEMKRLPVWDDGVANETGRDEVEVAVGTTTDIDIPPAEFPGEPPESGPFGFAPRVVLVSPGTTVRWVWTGNDFALRPGEPWPHDVVSTDGLFHSPHKREGTFEFEFVEPGTYRYYCSPHGNPGPEHPNLFGMRGAVLVRGN